MPNSFYSNQSASNQVDNFQSNQISKMAKMQYSRSTNPLLLLWLLFIFSCMKTSQQEMRQPLEEKLTVI